MRTTRILALTVAVALAGVLTAPAADPPTKADYKRATTNLKHIGVAFHNYASAYQDKLPGDITDKDGKSLLSWRVAILPYVEEDTLYKEFKLDEPWDSDHNKKLVAKMPKLYAPVRAKAKEGETFLQRFSGPGTLLNPSKYNIGNVPDGTSNTALVVEAADAVAWTKPADLPYDAKKKLPALGAQFDGECHVLLADGSVFRMKKDPDEAELRNLIQADDGNVIDIDKLKK